MQTAMLADIKLAESLRSLKGVSKGEAALRSWAVIITAPFETGHCVPLLRDTDLGWTKVRVETLHATSLRADS